MRVGGVRGRRAGEAEERGGETTHQHWEASMGEDGAEVMDQQVMFSQSKGIRFSRRK